MANLGVRPSLDPNDVNGGRVLLETHCLAMAGDSLGAEGAYGKIIRVELLHKLHDELKYDGLDALTAGIAKGLRRCARRLVASGHARSYTETRRQTAATNLEGCLCAAPCLRASFSRPSRSRFSRRVRPDCPA